MTILVCALWCIQGSAQERIATPNSSPSKKPWVVRTVNKIGAWIDSMAVRGIDQHYIQVPEKPWQLVLKANVSDMDLTSTTKELLTRKGIDETLTIESSFLPRESRSVGLWAGYRGYGLGYSFSLMKSDISHFSIGATGANYGVNLRIRRFSTNEFDAHIYINNGKDEFDFQSEAFTADPVNVRTAIFDGFYLLNGKRYSCAAAYDQSVVQVRSAGSLMVGLMWYQTSLDYSADRNGLIIQMLGDVGRVKIHEGSIGVGYAFNWVPAKNWLVNVTAMPLLAVYNRSKAYLYDCNYDIFLDDDEVSPTGKKPVPADMSEDWMDDMAIQEKNTIVKYGKMSLNLDARVSVTYNINRCFFNIAGQLNHFHNNVANSKLTLTDWYVNGAMGIRL